MRRGWPLVDWCCLCKSEEELANPILIQCRLARALWHLILFLFSLFWAFPRLKKFD